MAIYDDFKIKKMGAKDKINRMKRKNRVEAFREDLKENGLKTFEEKYKETSDRRISNLFDKAKLTETQKETLKNFYNFLMNISDSLDTHKTYLVQAKLLGERLGKEYKEITRQDLEKYLAELKQKGNKPLTLFNTRVTLRTFFKWLYDLKNGDPAPEVTAWFDMRKKYNYKMPQQIITLEEIQRMIKACTCFRDRALLSLLWEAGLRKKELISLRVGSIEINNDQGMVHVHYSKTVPRSLPIVHSVPSIIDWLNEHPLSQDKNAPLWINLGAWKDRNFGEDGLKRLIKVTANRAKVPREKAFTHNFRHSRATQLAKQGLNETELRLFFGWSKRSPMPEVYLHYNEEDMHNKVLKISGVDVGNGNAKKENLDLLNKKVCVLCNTPNPSTNIRCRNRKCGGILDPVEAMKQQEKMKEISDFVLTLKKAVSKDKELMDKIKGLV